VRIDGLGCGLWQTSVGTLTLQRKREELVRKQASALVSSSDLMALQDPQGRHLVKNRLARQGHLKGGLGARFQSWGGGLRPGAGAAGASQWALCRPPPPPSSAPAAARSAASRWRCGRGSVLPAVC